MSVATFNVKANPPRRSRAETIRMTNVGFTDKYKQNVKGIGRDLADAGPERRQYAKNWAKVTKLCKGCQHHDASNTSVGGHCTLPEQQECLK